MEEQRDGRRVSKKFAVVLVLGLIALLMGGKAARRDGIPTS
ncbi:hypothetical protein [Nocardia terpenica]|nr:hypothetical protein [Nocardia terpenica]